MEEIEYLSKISGEGSDKPVSNVEPTHALAFGMKPSELTKELTKIGVNEGQYAAMRYLTGQENKSPEEVFELARTAVRKDLNGEQMLSLYIAKDYAGQEVDMDALAEVGAALPDSLDNPRVLRDTILTVKKSMPYDIEAGLEAVAKTAEDHGISSPEAAINFTLGVTDEKGRLTDEDDPYDQSKLKRYQDHTEKVEEPDE